MRANDISFYWSAIYMVCLVIIYASLASAYSQRAIGVIYATAIIHFVLVTISLLGNIIANRVSSPEEKRMQVSAYVIFYVPALIYLFVAFDLSVLSKKDQELNAQELREKKDATSYITT